VAAKALEPSAVARWNSKLGVHVDAAALAHALVPAGACRVHDAKERLARSIASEAVARGRCTAEGRERELLADRLHGVALGSQEGCATKGPPGPATERRAPGRARFPTPQPDPQGKPLTRPGLEGVVLRLHCA